MGPAEYRRGTNDVTRQPEFIRLHVLTKICKVSETNLVGRICLLSLKYVMWVSLVKRGDQRGKNVLRCLQGAVYSWAVVVPGKEWASGYLHDCGNWLRMFRFMPIPLACWVLNFSICVFKFSMLSIYFPTSWDVFSKIETMYEILQPIFDFEWYQPFWRSD